MKKKPIPLFLVVAVLLLSGLLLVACNSSEPTPVEVTREVEVEVVREVEVEVTREVEVEMEVVREVEVEVEATRVVEVEVEVEVTRVVEVEVETPAPQSAALACSDINSEALGLDNVEITSAEVVANDGLYPAYCLVGGTANERTGIDGKSYAIGFELRLPVAWNGRFLYQANGGNDGTVVPAEGNNSTPNSAGDVSALRRGFAVLSTDAGHSGSDPANAELGLVNGNVFGLDPQARADYGYASVGTMTPIAKQIVSAHYGTEPAYSYMYGCSNGGRHGMVAASRYAEQFDGILAGNPGFNLPRAAVQHAWDVQSFQIANPDIREAFSPEDMNLIAAGVVAACDAQDGAEDGIVADMRVCQDTFNLADLQCTGEKNESCLTADQVTALERSMGGPINSEGEQLYSEWAYDGGMGSGNWRFWKLESQIPPWDFYPLIATLGGGSLSYIFTTPPTETPGTPADLVEFLTNFDFDTDAPKIFATDETFTESPQEFMTPPDVDDPTLSELQAAGGKLLVYHGTSDGVFSVVDTIDWYEELAANNGGDASDFARLFVIPGMNHCSGGPATDQFDALTALINWVESEQAPEQIIATVDPTNPELPESWSPSRSRPLCPWPQIAKLKEGETEEVDLESADSFECRSPAMSAAESATEGAAELACESLVDDFTFDNTSLAEATVVAAEEGDPEYCLVTGLMNERTSDVDGKEYAIQFEMRLPTDWNGRFLYQGNGGTDGFVAPAIGRIGAPQVTGLQHGFAIISSDAGHPTRAADFGLDPQARLDYGYQAVGTLTPMAKALIERAYGQAPNYSYIGGTSNGGRHAMVAASRYPDDYDGILAIAPGFNLPRAAVAQLWGAQRWSTVATDLAVPGDEPDTGLATALTGAEREVIASAILEQCDSLDGLGDGMVQDIFGCQSAFDLARDVPVCSGERDGTCLSSAQLEILADVFDGAETSDGESFYSSWVYDAGIRQQNWADWKFLYSVNNQRDAVAYGYIFGTPPNPPGEDTLGYALDLDIDEAVDAIFATDDTYTESSMSFMTPPDPTNLDTLREGGAKMLVVHGASDAIFSMQDTVNWFNDLDAAYGDDAEEFARLFLVPGMGHSRGGPATDQYDALMALVDWVEEGEAPERIIANVQEGNPDVASQGWDTSRTRPLCMYPAVATYTEGDEESADSFECVAP